MDTSEYEFLRPEDDQKPAQPRQTTLSSATDDNAHWIANIEAMPADHPISDAIGLCVSGTSHSNIVYMNVYLHISAITYSSELTDKQKDMRVKIANHIFIAKSPSPKKGLSEGFSCQVKGPCIDVCISLVSYDTKSADLLEMIGKSAKSMFSSLKKKKNKFRETYQEDRSGTFKPVASIDKTTSSSMVNLSDSKRFETVARGTIHLSEKNNACSGVLELKKPWGQKSVLAKIEVRLAAWNERTSMEQSLQAAKSLNALPAVVKKAEEKKEARTDCTHRDYLNIYTPEKDGPSVWMRYWVVLRDTKLHIYHFATKDETVSIGTIDLGKVLDVAGADRERISVSWCLSMEIEQAGKIFAYADTKGSYEAWIQVLRKILKK